MRAGTAGAVASSAHELPSSNKNNESNLQDIKRDFKLHRFLICPSPFGAFFIELRCGQEESTSRYRRRKLLIIIIIRIFIKFASG